jgi:hypothetical protein
MKRWFFAFIFLMFTLNAHALTSQNITIDGVMTDWTSPVDITTAVGQSATDCSSGQVCELDAISGSGRDLANFSFTWNDTYLFLHVKRYVAGSPSTDWLFYLDEDADGFMETGERIFRIQWKGSNRNTDAMFCPYFPVDTINGDPLVSGGKGDGYDMPGGSSNSCTSLYAGVIGGSASGFEMESRVSWAQLGFTGPTNIGFHVSSSQGVNLPGQIIDNVDPPSGGQLFPPDMEIALSSGVSSVQSNSTMTFDVTLTNLMFEGFTNVVNSISLPTELVYQSSVVPAGTSFVDTDADTIPDEWQVPILLAEESLVLQITVLAQPVPFATNVDIDGVIVSSTETDSDATNNTDTLTIQITPAPELTVLKYSSDGNAPPLTQDVIYSSLLTNQSAFTAQNIVVIEDLSKFTAFKLGSVSVNLPPSPYVASGLTVSAIEYFNGITWAHVPASGLGGVPAGYDGTVSRIRITFTGTIDSNEGILVNYTSIVK